MGVKLRENIKKSGVKSLYLDITTNGKRYKEYIGLHLLPAKSPEARERNKEIKRMAEGKRAARELELQARDFDYTPAMKTKVDFVAYFAKFVEVYPHKDIRIVRYSYEWFVKYLATQSIRVIRVKDLTPELCSQYLEFMQQGLNGETPYNYFSKFRRVVRKAVKDGLITHSPTEDIKVVRDEGLKKDILTFDEIQGLAQAYCGNAEVKRAFLFSLVTGLRWCDVSELKFKHVDFSGLSLKITQQKTKQRSKNATVTIPLNPTAITLIGEKGEPGDNVFTLPSHTGCLKSLRLWCEKAGIDKHITWHCARHSFAVNLLGELKTDVKTVADLLGHSGLKTVEKYTRAVDELKKRAVNSMPEINIK